MENIKCIIPPKEVLDRLNAIPIYATAPKQNKQTLIRYTYSNNIDTFKKVFTLEEVEGGCQFEEISDSPLLRDYRIVNREVLMEAEDEK